MKLKNFKDIFVKHKRPKKVFDFLFLICAHSKNQSSQDNKDHFKKLTFPDEHFFHMYRPMIESYTND